MHLFSIIFSVLLLSFTLLSLIRHDYWTFRIFDYPRLQKLVLSIICLLIIIFFYKGPALYHWILGGLMSINAIYLFIQIVPFTILGKKQVLCVKKDISDQSLSIMIANVYQDNINSKGCLQEINKNDPDIVLLLETNQRWDEQTKALEKKYPFHVKVPLENTYGMLLYANWNS